MSIFAERLRELIGEHPSVNAFAGRVGLGTSLVRKYLDGAVPGIDKALQIAERTEVPIAWLLGVSAERHPATRRQATLNADLLGRVVDRIARVYREEGVRLQDVELGRLAAERYQEISDDASDPEEWPALLDLMAVRLRRQLRAAAADPANVKREA